MRTKLPDDHGWYWCKDRDDCWYMAFVDTGDETVAAWDGDNPMQPPLCFDFESAEAESIVAWYGPINCPGGDFGGITVLGSEEDYEKCEREKKAFGLQHYDYSFCKDGNGGASLTIYGAYTREEADKRIQREVKEETKHSSPTTGQENGQ